MYSTCKLLLPLGNDVAFVFFDLLPPNKTHAKSNRKHCLRIWIPSRSTVQRTTQSSNTRGFHGQKVNLGILALVGYCCYKPPQGNTTSHQGFQEFRIAPDSKAPPRVIPRLAGEMPAGARLGTPQLQDNRSPGGFQGAQTRAISPPTCPRDRTRLDLFSLSRARSGAFNLEQLELPGGA